MFDAIAVPRQGTRPAGLVARIQAQGPSASPDRPTPRLFEAIPAPRRASPDRAERPDGASSGPLPDPAPLFGGIARAPVAATAADRFRAELRREALEALPPQARAEGLFAAEIARSLGARAARRGRWSFAAAAFQATLVAALAVASANLHARRLPEGAVAVSIIRAPRRATPYAPHAPASSFAGRRAQSSASPRATIRPPPPSALLQPREIRAEMKPPDPSEPVEEAGPAGAGDAEGVVGGVPFAAMDAARQAEPAGPSPGGEVEDAPQWVTSGFRKPAEARAGCVRDSIRLPPDLTGFVSERLTVKFAVGRDGAVSAIEILGAVADRRVADAIRQALAGCRWIPGTDPRGQPVSLWVILPIRFASG
ncbi:MAG TPA: hypothetical protein VLU43_13510 [Anaeromyxobacteraceae bacterium]|nr:hypothetical protein [Anaeromyxobacteraceae bacterium]